MKIVVQKSYWQYFTRVLFRSTATSSAPQQHKSAQYKWFAFYLHIYMYRHAAAVFYQLQGGFGGRWQHARIHAFLSVLFSLQLILQFTEGSNGFIADKTILILYQGSRGGPLFSRGGGWGVQLFPKETHIRTCYFPGGVWTPYPPLDPHMSNVIIMGQYLSQSRF